MSYFDETDFHEETIAEGAERYAEKISFVDKNELIDSTLSTTECIMVALALCDRRYLPKGFGDIHAKTLWFRLNDKQRGAITIWARDQANEVT